MRLSIIIPCYNAEPYINELLARLNGQMTEEVEVIVIDDGSREEFHTDYQWCKVVRQENKGVSAARNKGLDLATGEYIAFIDADDMVNAEYIKKIFAKIDDENPDYIYLSWKTLPGGWAIQVQLHSIEDQFPSYNLCVWNRVYRRDLIGDVRFNTNKKIAEDAEFIRSVELNGKKKAFISDFMYFYRSDTPNSLTKRFVSGNLDSRRVVYNFRRVTRDMTYLIDEFKEINEDAEIILMTECNDIPELEKYALIMQPGSVYGTEVRGEPTDKVKIIKRPIKTQVVMWTRATYDIGGLETFIYAFCQKMHEYYDIIVLYDAMDARQLSRLRKYVECRKVDPDVWIECETLIVNRIIDPMPHNVRADRTVQMVHTIKYGSLTVPQNKDQIVTVSQAVKDSFTEETKDAEVILNMMPDYPKKRRPLLIVSATRTDTNEKGAQRLTKFANLMNAQGVPFVWLCFTNAALPKDAPGNMARLQPTIDILPYIEMADILVQLSNCEAFCYSIVEAWSVGTFVVSTPIEVLPEIGGIEGVNMYTVPFDIPDDYDTTKFLNIPKFEYSFDNKESIKRWRKLLGDSKPTHKYVYTEDSMVEVLQRYYDTYLKREVVPGEVVCVPRERADGMVERRLGREV